MPSAVSAAAGVTRSETRAGSRCSAAPTSSDMDPTPRKFNAWLSRGGRNADLPTASLVPLLRLLNVRIVAGVVAVEEQRHQHDAHRDREKDTEQHRDLDVTLDSQLEAAHGPHDQ